MPSRRQFLAAVGVSGAFGVAGCTASDEGDSAATTTDDAPPDPTKDAYGSDGEWSSFGFDAANTRWNRDETGPTTGVTELWRYDGGWPRAEPLVVDGAVLHLGGEALDAIDAESGEKRWERRGVDNTPFVRDGTLYASDADSLFALDLQTGEERWRKPFRVDTSPALGLDNLLYFGRDETLFALDLETRKIAWRRQLFGELNPHIAMVYGGYPCVSTEAGFVYWFLSDGVGQNQWKLPAETDGSPTAGNDFVYVGCVDGNVYALDFDDGSVAWKTRLLGGGVPSRYGIAHGGRLVYAVGLDELVALDERTGEKRWSVGIGDEDRLGTAPVVTEDAVYVGGDELKAIKREGGSGIGSYRFDPTLFSESFGGPVGVGPVVDDGVIYTYAETSEGTYHLLALEAA